MQAGVMVVGWLDRSLRCQRSHVPDARCQVPVRKMLVVDGTRNPTSPAIGQLCLRLRWRTCRTSQVFASLDLPVWEHWPTDLLAATAAAVPACMISRLFSHQHLAPSTSYHLSLPATPSVCTDANALTERDQSSPLHFPSDTMASTMADPASELSPKFAPFFGMVRCKELSTSTPI